MDTITDRRRPPAPNGIGFYGGPFSNFVGDPIVVCPGAYADQLFENAGSHGGLRVIAAPTVEHYFQAMKATTGDEFLHIISAPGPEQAKRRGRSIGLRADWENVREAVMWDALVSKFEREPYRAVLLSTGDAFIYEDSPTDTVWGMWNEAEGRWTGQNLLGKLLMELRSRLVEEVLAA